MTADWEWVPCGPQAVMVKFRGPGGVLRASVAAERIHKLGIPEIVDATPAFDQLLVEFQSEGDLEFKIGRLIDIPSGLTLPSGLPARVLTIPVIYDGADLPRIVDHTGLTESEVIARHVAPLYEVALIGFSPGFPYLEGLDDALIAPRLPSPRPVIPAGSVAIGGSHTGIYSVPTPGGWNLIGHTDVKIFDPSKGGTDAFLFRVGDRVKFEVV